MVSSLFRHIEALQGEKPWGRFLDAGTGVNSSLWAKTLALGQWSAVTGSDGHAEDVRRALGPQLQGDDRLIVGNWTDATLLAGEVFDTVLADYLVGAVEGFAPYFQSSLFRRLAPLVGGRLYVVGLDPYVLGPKAGPEAAMVRAIGRLRDTCLLLADETPYREFPAEWVADSLTQSGFEVLSLRRFANRYKDKWVNGQLDMALRRLKKVAPGLAAPLRERIEALRAEGLALCQERGGLRAGHDYVIACRRRT